MNYKSNAICIRRIVHSHLQKYDSDMNNAGLLLHFLLFFAVGDDMFKI